MGELRPAALRREFLGLALEAASLCCCRRDDRGCRRMREPPELEQQPWLSGMLGWDAGARESAPPNAPRSVLGTSSRSALPEAFAARRGDLPAAWFYCSSLCFPAEQHEFFSFLESAQRTTRPSLPASCTPSGCCTLCFQ